MDKRSRWRTQEQELVARWNAAVARHRDVLAEIALAGGNATSEALVLKADASAEVRQANEEAARVMQKGRLVHIDGAGHNLHHDDLERTVEVLREFLSGL